MRDKISTGEILKVFETIKQKNIPEYGNCDATRLAYSAILKYASDSRNDNYQFGKLGETLVRHVFDLEDTSHISNCGDARNLSGEFIEIKTSAPSSSGYRIGQIRPHDTICLLCSSTEQHSIQNSTISTTLRSSNMILLNSYPVNMEIRKC